MNGDDLNWRVEDACLNAWPAPRQVIMDGWLLRCAGGPTRRVNSANPLHAGAEASLALVEKVEAFYAAQGRPSVFRIADMAGAIDGLLATRGYAIDAPTRTLFARLDEQAPQTAGEVRIESSPSRAWLAARDRLSGADEAARQATRAILGAIALPGAYASLIHRGRIAALAFAVVQGDLVVLESVMTDARYRRRGLARACVSALLDWARGQGAHAAALQVMAGNDAALGLYEGLGFGRTLYGYHYRMKR